MATTTTWGIVYPVVGNTITPLATHFANQANSVDAALTNVSKSAGTPSVADAAARGVLFPSPVNGNSVYRLDTKAVEIYNGAAWLSYDNQAVAFTPTWSGVTVGNGISGGYYQRYGATAHAQMWFKLGSTSSITASIRVALPVAPVISSPVIGSAYFESVGTAVYHQPGVSFGSLHPILTSASSPHVELFAVNTGTTWSVFSSANGTQPVSWAANGGFTLDLTWKIA